jgi:hypothetical protein
MSWAPTIAVHEKQAESLEQTFGTSLPCSGKHIDGLCDGKGHMARCNHQRPYPFDKVFPLSASEVQLPVRKRIYTISQLMEVDDLSGHLMLDLAPYPFLQLKL